MAYNVLKGSVEGSVDQHGDQEINGTKIFKNTISASVFYDTDAQSPCATIKDVAIQKVIGGSENCILMIGANKSAKAIHNLKYENDTLSANNIAAQTIKGSGEKLTNIPSDKFSEPIKAQYLSHHYGLENVRGNLQVKAAEGIKCNEDGISVNVAVRSGLELKSNKLCISAPNTTEINSSGQTLSDPDLLLVHDTSRNMLTHTTLSNLFDTYINTKVPHASGTPGAIQFRGKKEFQSSDKFYFDNLNSVLNIAGKLKANSVVSTEKTINEGAVYNNISKVSSKKYEVSDNDYTILCDASQNIVKINLPAAKNNTGRVLVIKKTNTDKYKLNSNVVYVTCEEGTIDINDRIEIKMNYSSRTVQSDGENWWIIGSKGT